MIESVILIIILLFGLFVVGALIYAFWYCGRHMQREERPWRRPPPEATGVPARPRPSPPSLTAQRVLQQYAESDGMLDPAVHDVLVEQAEAEAHALDAYHRTLKSHTLRMEGVAHTLEKARQPRRIRIRSKNG